jgi:hypothetical protein
MAGATAHTIKIVKYTISGREKLSYVKMCRKQLKMLHIKNKNNFFNIYFAI